MNNFVPNNDHYLRRYRNIRNDLLKQTDKYLLTDFPINENEKIEVINYRSNLRQFINDNKDKILNGEKIEFPEQPNFININIK